MKITRTITIAASLLLAAGCAHDDHYYGASAAPGSAYSSEYNSTENNSTENAATENNENNISTSSSQNNVNVSGGVSGSSENTLETQIQQSLSSDAGLTAVAPNIHVTINNGVVTLTGAVNDDQQKEKRFFRKV